MKRILLSLSLVAIVATVAVGATRAFFSDTETSVANTFTAGTLKLNEEGIQAFNFGTLPAMAPGEKTEERVIVIKNDGTIPLAWFGNLVVGGGVKLREAIYIDYAKMEFKDNDEEADWEPIDNFITNGLGSGSWPTTWTGMDNLATLKAFDDNENMAPGTPFEFMGALKPGYSYRLTLKFGFAPNAGDEFQGNVPGNDPVTVAFEVKATQLNTAALEALYASLGNHLVWLNAQIAKQD